MKALQVVYDHAFKSVSSNKFLCITIMQIYNFLGSPNDYPNDYGNVCATVSNIFQTYSYSMIRQLIVQPPETWDDNPPNTTPPHPALVTFPSAEEDAILRIMSWSWGSEAYWASSYSTLVRGGLVMSR